jgi:hypothetical protein
MLLLLVVGVALSICTVSAASPGPQAGSIGLTGEMPGKPPVTGATIDQPTQGQHFSSTPITVSGTCPPKTLVEIYKNDIFAGSTACSDSGTYSLDIDLLIGKNKLIARVYDSLNQPGPDSNAITVFYDALPPQASSLAPLNLTGNQLVLNTDAVFRGTFPGQDMHMPIDIIGGTPPYAVNVQWGDSSNKVISRSNNITFTASHSYHKSGVYQITLQGTDARGRVAFLTVAAIVNGQPDVLLASGAAKPPMNKLLMLWPLYVSAAVMVISFWLGERREKHILLHQPVIYHPQIQH